MKVISFNANGIRSAAKKGFFIWLAEQDADFVCIQETKAQVHQLQAEAHFCPAGYFCEYVDAEKKGYSGVALYAKKKPFNIVTELGFATADNEGRYVQFDYADLSVISLYLPSGTSGDERQAVKMNFLEQLIEPLQGLKKSGREVILCGDYNIAHQPIDLKNWRANQTHSGFLPEERAWLDRLFGDLGFVDAFRVINQAPDQYTWWSHRGRAREKNVGWRIDYQVITPGLVSRVYGAAIETSHYFSDHAPLTIEYDGL
ncbi:MAG: exodeoxyribonuclease III [Legionellales bacterium RIFCSPHIGHO2_12_FULL_42_9]|nr:MAG: exodeoxyribonuclease III [Legionellales bacterium RIFCSPHIGHO2_12_FULL_42_9]